MRRALKRFERIGKRYGNLLVVEIQETDSQGRPIYRCLCDCGKDTFPRADWLEKRREKQSCGCLNREPLKIREQKQRQSQREWYKKNRERILERRLSKQYGLSASEYNRLLKAQNFCCQLCNLSQSQNYMNKLFVDHCHASGKVRQLLCLQCNAGIGMFREDTKVMEAAIKYLKRFEPQS